MIILCFQEIVKIQRSWNQNWCNMTLTSQYRVDETYYSNVEEHAIWKFHFTWSRLLLRRYDLFTVGWFWDVALWLENHNLVYTFSRGSEKNWRVIICTQTWTPWPHTNTDISNECKVKVGNQITKPSIPSSWLILMNIQTYEAYALGLYWQLSSKYWQSTSKNNTQDHRLKLMAKLSKRQAEGYRKISLNFSSSTVLVSQWYNTNKGTCNLLNSHLLHCLLLHTLPRTCLNNSSDISGFMQITSNNHPKP